MKIGKLELRNRFVRSATYDGCADKTGQVSEKQMKIFPELANGGSWIDCYGNYVYS
jgi:2,4-dienoyl-CoA reductase-like NADH-dependent reductase (Old Yellow Enzyme family)